MSESFPTDAAVNSMVEPFMEAAGIEPARHSPRMRWLYFIQEGSKNGAIKIGIARDLKERLRMLQVGNRRELYVLEAHRFESKRAAELERILHSKLVHHQIVREWFKPHPDVIAASRDPLRFVGDVFEAIERNRLILESL